MLQVTREYEDRCGSDGKKASKGTIGVVIEVNNIRNPTTNRIQTTITANYTFPGNVTKRKTVHLKSIHVPTVSGTDVPNQDGAVNHNNDSKNNERLNS